MIKKKTYGLGSITSKDILLLLYWLLFKRKYIVKGNYIQMFESKFARYVGTKHALSFNSARESLYVILKAMGIGAGDEVIVPGYTCVVVPQAVVFTGAKPIYVDVNKDTMTIDSNKLNEKITPKTKAIIVQHTFQWFCDIQHKEIPVIEDCAHSLGAEYKGKKTGTFGRVAFFTFQRQKIMTTGTGGMVATDDDTLNKKMLEIQNTLPYLQKKVITKRMFNLIYQYLFGNNVAKYLTGKSYSIDKSGDKKPSDYPLRMSNMQARLGIKQLEQLTENLNHRRAIGSCYSVILNKEEDEDYSPSYVRYGLVVKDKRRFKQLWEDAGYSVGKWFKTPIHPADINSNNVFYKKGMCPNAEYISDHVVNLPTGLNVKKKDVGRLHEKTELWMSNRY